jgi:hypothetical protein
MADVNPSSLFAIFKSDSADALKPIIPNLLRAYFCLDLTRVTDAPILQHQPPLISIAVYLNAIKCAEFLVNHGADIDATDVFFAFSVKFFWQTWSSFF